LQKCLLRRFFGNGPVARELQRIPVQRGLPPFIKFGQRRPIAFSDSSVQFLVACFHPGDHSALFPGAEKFPAPCILLGASSRRRQAECTTRTALKCLKRTETYQMDAAWRSR